MITPVNGQKGTAVRRRFGLGPTLAVRRVGGDRDALRVTYAAAEPTSIAAHLYACAHGDQINAGSMTVDAAPSCSKGQVVVSWNQNGLAARRALRALRA